MAMNYRKWDNLHDSDDENFDGTDDATVPQAVEANCSLMLLASWMSEAAPTLGDELSAKLVRFIALSDLSWAAKRPGAAPPRAKSIVDFLEKEGEPSFSALVSLCHVAKRKSDDKGQGQAAKTAAGRALIMAMGCLNTLHACRQNGGARNLFDLLKQEPRGDLRKSLDAYKFAQEAIRESLAADDDDPTHEAIPPKPTMSEADEAVLQAMRSASIPSKSAQPPSSTESRWRRVATIFARTAGIHVAFVLLGMACQEGYKLLYAVPAAQEL